MSFFPPQKHFTVPSCAVILAFPQKSYDDIHAPTASSQISTRSSHDFLRLSIASIGCEYTNPSIRCSTSSLIIHTIICFTKKHQAQIMTCACFLLFFQNSRSGSLCVPPLSSLLRKSNHHPFDIRKFWKCGRHVCSVCCSQNHRSKFRWSEFERSENQTQIGRAACGGKIPKYVTSRE
jgi:hypothetical protein